MRGTCARGVANSGVCGTGIRGVASCGCVALVLGVMQAVGVWHWW